MSFDTSIFKTLSLGEGPSKDQLRKALTSILNGEANDAQVSALLMGLEVKGVSAEDVQVGTEVMRTHMVPVQIEGDVIDIVGTGGTGLHTLSISTATAIVSAACGAKVAKHGNRAASSLTGTADTLSQLGVNLAMTPERAADCIREAGIGFLFAPNHHPAMRHVGPARKSLGIRTIFNMLGPLSNPARASRMLLGVCENRWRRPMAETMLELGADHLWVVRGSDGMDEITTTGTTYVSEVKNGQISEFEITPQEFGIETVELAELRGGTPDVNAKALSDLLDGNPSAYRDIVRLNAGAALMIAGLSQDIPDGILMATDAIDNGHAKATLARLVEVSNG